MNTPVMVNSRPAMIIPLALQSPSIIWEPKPQSHSGSRTVND